MNRSNTSMLLAACLLVGHAASARAETDPRDVFPLPPGMNGLLLYSKNVYGNRLYHDGSLATSDLNLDANLAILRGVHYGQLGPLQYNVNFLLPIGQQQVSGAAVGNTTLQASGIGDAILVAGVYPLWNPATKAVVAVVGYVTAPTGEYSSTSAINMGDNRWVAKPELILGHGIGDRVTVELGGSVSFYQDNTAYTAGRFTSKKDPLLNLMAHLAYDPKPGVMLAASYFWNQGGETTVEELGGPQNDGTDIHSAMLSGGFMLSPSTQLLLQYRYDFAVAEGLKTTQLNGRVAWLF